MLERAEDKRKNIEIVGIESLEPSDHLLQKIEKAVDFQKIYGMVEQYYSADNGRPSADPVILVKICLIQHLFRILALRNPKRQEE
ncbi:MAG: hypothetical protein FWF05_08950 [Oscillospiraceae bacterium]|nr:hypothetical protein [Oscillospiraceae bacterium]